MGQAYGHVLTVIENEFVRVQETEDVLEAGKSIDYIQLRQIRLPETYQLNTKHIGVLFCVDFNKDGVFSYDDLRNFLSWCCEALPPDVGDDVVASVQGRCLLKLWSDCKRAPEGDDSFFDWLLLLMQRTYPKHVWRAASPARSESTGSSTSSGGSSDDDDEDEDTTGGAAGVSSSVDLLSPPEQPMPSVDDEAADALRHHGAEEGKYRFGPACTALVYDLLQVDAVHGLSYPVFVNLLHAAGGSVDPLRIDTESPTFPTSSPLRNDDDVTDFGDGPSFDVPEGDDTPSGDPLRTWVTEDALRGFVVAFLASLWTTLDRLGLLMLTDGD